MTDEEYNLVTALNTISKEYLELSKVYEKRKINKLKSLLHLLSQKRFKELFRKTFIELSLFIHPLKNSEILADCKDINSLYKKDDYEIEKYFKKTPKIVIYTHISNGYDIIKNPVYYNNKYKYVMYTDIPINQVDTNSIWEYRQVPKEFLNLKNNTSINRAIKLNPKLLFPDYDVTVYIDGSIRILSDITPLIKITLNSRTGLGLHSHMFRDCLYDESHACIRLRRGTAKNIKKQIEEYRKEDFPRNFGLFEATVIIAHLNNQIANNLLNEWYEDFSKRASMRDQLSFPYIIWKNGYSKSDVGNLGDNIDRNPLIKRFSHN